MAEASDSIAIEITAAAQSANSAINGLQQTLGKYNTAIANGSKNSNNFSHSLAALAVKATAALYVLRKIGNVIGGLFKANGDYIEAVNLFRVTMGEAADEAANYAKRVESLLGINSEDWFTNQGSFQQLIVGFGVGADKATIMSKNLTQLGYDLASVFNTDVETAMQKLQSGMSGMVKGLRAYGIETSVAALQEYALDKGIQQSVSSMSMAQRTLLRYNLIMERSVNIQGDMARTLISPANALRILGEQWEIAKRNMGAVVTIIATKVIPVFQAVVQVVSKAAAAIASFFGYNIEDYLADLSNLNSNEWGAGAEDTEEALAGAAGSAKKIKDYLMGFDELNIIKPDEPMGGSGGGVGGGGWESSLGLFDNDSWLDGLEDRAETSLSKIGDIFKPALEKLKQTFLILKGQFGEIDLLGAIKERAIASLETLSSAVTLAFGVINPLLEGLNLPKIWITAIELVTEAFKTIKNVLDSLRKGLEDFSNTVLKPIAQWLNEQVVKILNRLKEYLAAIGDWFKSNEGMFSDLLGSLGDALKAIWDCIAPIANILGEIGLTAIGVALSVIAEALKLIVPLITWILDLITPLFQMLADGINATIGYIFGVGESSTTLWSDITGLWGSVSTWFNDNVIQPIVNFFSPAIEFISSLFEGCWLIIQAVWISVSEWFSTKVTQPVTDKFNLIWTKVSGFFTSLWNDIKKIWAPVAKWFDTTIIQPLVNNFTTAWESIKTTFETVFKAIGNFAIGIFNGVISSVEWVINGIIGAINSFLSGINSMIQWAAGVVGTSYSGVTLIQNVTLSRIPMFANGGFPEDGAFFANSGELVGQFSNGKTAVANNEQITEGIASAVYRAVSAALNENSSSGDFDLNVYISGKQVNAEVEKVQKERGVSIMSGGVAYSY